MRKLALRKPETSFQVLHQVFLLLGSSNDGLIHLVLVSHLGFWEGLLWFGLALREKFGFCRDRTLGRSLGEVSIVDLGVDLERR